jgi:hypothetical protein
MNKEKEYKVGDLLRRGGNNWDKQITFGSIIKQKTSVYDGVYFVEYVVAWFNNENNLIEKQTLIEFELEELLNSTLWNWKHYPANI